MDDNRFAPPKAVVEGAYDSVEAAPPLWNPNAAASWCLLLTPIFGTWLHLKNWLAMGEVERAGSARTWFILSIVVVLGSIVLAAIVPGPLVSSVRVINFGFLIAWYYAAAKPQVKYVKGRFGDGYPRRGWGVPIIFALVIGFSAVIALGILIGLARAG